jgi:predicted DNA-binding transcriptional regulator AlpA
MSPDVVQLAELAEVLGVTKRTAQRYIARPDFPQPAGRFATGRIWNRADVEQWGRDHLPLPRPGRPPKTAE